MPTLPTPQIALLPLLPLVLLTFLLPLVEAVVTRLRHMTLAAEQAAC
jgi:hypothetical protein